ncbi:MAG: Nif11-like leader peptide family natural product precursor [Bacteroidota bacterium]|nr:Nif11-like leader peptide family natural product precursor [Bacteroidota bacterium]
MPIQHAINLLQTIGDNKALRKELYGCTNSTELEECLKKNGYVFSLGEFEEAERSLHVRCQTQQEAFDLLEKASWFKMVVLSNNGASRD